MSAPRPLRHHRLRAVRLIALGGALSLALMSASVAAAEAADAVPDVGASTIVTSAAQLTAAATATLTVQLRDSSGAALGPGDADYSAITVSIVRVSADAGGTVGPVSNNSDGTFSATLTAPGAEGAEDFGFTVDGASSSSTVSVQYVASGSLSLATSTISVPPPSHIAANGVSYATVQVTLHDASGAAYTAHPPAVFHVSGVQSPWISSPTTYSDGQWWVDVTSPTTVGTETLGFSVDGVVAPGQVQITYVTPPTLVVQFAHRSIARGGTQKATLRGLQPGEVVDATMFSHPVDLGTKTVPANGAVTFTWKIGQDIDLGTHSVQLNGRASGDATGTFTITAAVRSDVLAETGATMAWPLLGLGALLAVLGAGLVSRSRHSAL